MSETSQNNVDSLLFYSSINRDYVEGKRPVPEVYVPFIQPSGASFGGLSIVLGFIGLMFIFGVSAGAFQRPIDTVTAQIREIQTLDASRVATLNYVIDNVSYSAPVDLTQEQYDAITSNTVIVAYNRYAPENPQLDLDYVGGPFGFQNWGLPMTFFIGLLVFMGFVLIRIPFVEVPRTRKLNKAAIADQLQRQERLLNDGTVVYGTVEKIGRHRDHAGDVVGYILEYVIASPQRAEKAIKGKMPISKKVVGDADPEEWTGRPVAVLYADDDLHRML